MHELQLAERNGFEPREACWARRRAKAVSARLVLFWIHPAVDVVVEALEPDESGQFVAARGIEARHHPGDVGEDLPHMRDHLAVVDAGRRHLLRGKPLGVLSASRPIGEFARPPLERPGARRAEIGVQAPTADLPP